MSEPKEKSLTSRVLVGAGWAIAMRWAVKFLGLASTAVLARLLMPEDYGLVAMAMIAVGITQVLFELGVATALIQNENAAREHFDTAWTIRLFQAALVAILIAVISPYAAKFFEEPRLQLILQLVAISIVINGFENIGVVLFRKKLQFNKDFQFFVVNKLVGVTVTISLAFYFRSYFALVLGMISQSIINVSYSYVISQYRPKFSLAVFAELWQFSKWMIVRDLSDYVGKQGDAMFLSKLTTAQGLGFYTLGAELSTTSTSEIVFPMLRSLMPALVKLKSEKERLESAFLDSTGMIAVVAIPLAMGFAGVASEFIPLFFGGGDKWGPVIPIVQILAFSAMFQSLYIVAADMLIVIGFIRLTAYTSWMRTFMVLALMYPAFKLGGVEGVATAQVLIGVVSSAVVYLVLKFKMALPLGRLVGVLWRPMVAGLIMAYLLFQLDYQIVDVLFLILLTKVLSGMIIYFVTLYSLWMLSGRPNSGEKKIALMISQKLLFKWSTRKVK